ncbi:MAG TPA: hypothetical protein VMA09_06985 [Candidatus Binataceae bacterium]|nr:hypothetical protein [Candidatus Binataceae bacterium]
MASKASRTLTAAAIAVALLSIPMAARALEVKKELGPYGGGGGGGGSAQPSGGGPQRANPIPKAAQQQLMQTVSDDSDSFLNAESEKKSSGQPYMDLEHAKFSYLPAQKGGKITVEAKLTASEYKPPKSGEGRGKATGNSKALVFNYQLDGNKWTSLEPPKWEDVKAEAAKSK